MRPLFFSLSLLSSAFAVSNPSVTISAGTVEGTHCPSTNAKQFLNIPYAQPPLDELRFAPPQPYNTSYNSGTIIATTPGPPCIQFGTAFLENGTASEDCLHLDIWAPSKDTQISGLPVKVWIYGGGEQSGGISNPMYNGCNSAAEGFSLVVGINYRLGPLGFLALESAGIAGNQGILDILMGLQWIQENIAAFGGDPTKVMLFGQSAGATNAFIISTLPQAKSLISSTISESGGGRDLAPNSTLQAVGASFAASLNCAVTDITCLRSKSPTQLNASTPEGPGTIIYSGLNPQNFQPYVDGSIIPSQPSTVGTRVPTIFGSNTDEGSLFVLGQYLLSSFSLTPSNYSDFLAQNFGSAASLVNETYPLSAYPSPFDAMSQIITHASYFCPAHRALQTATKNGVPVYTYLYNHTSTCSWLSTVPAPVLPFLGATHTFEIPFVFGNLDALPLPNGTCNSTAGEYALSSTLINAWTGMAENGNPSAGGAGLKWPLWTGNQSLGLVVGNETAGIAEVDYSPCAFWDGVGESQLLNFTAGGVGGSGNTTGTGSGTGTATGAAKPSSTNAATRMGSEMLGSALVLLAILVIL